MKINRLHIIFFLLLIISTNLNGFSINSFQEPQQTRQFDKNFKERYTGDKYNYEGKKIITETPSGSGKYEDYKKGDPKYKEKNDSEDLTINFGPFGWLFYIALAIAVVYLVYILFNEGGSGLFSSKRHQKINNFDDITSENIENTDINSLIKKAENDSDYRLAIRYYYLLVLKMLTKKNHIKFEDDKTNSEYLNELNETPFNEKFAYTSYLYNYIWYGKFPLNIKQYTKAKSNFTTLLKVIK